MTIYVDVIFLENLIMNLAIIFSEAICLNSTDKKFRKVLAGIVSSTFYIVQLIFPQLGYLQWIVTFVLMIIAFGKSHFTNLIKQVLLYYFISFLFGGISFALMSAINRGRFSIFNGVVIGRFGFDLIFVSGVLAFFLVKLFLKRRKEHVLQEIVISICGKAVEIKVLLDTGNLLREPYKNRPVVIVEKSVLSNSLGENNIDSILSGKKEVPIGMFLIPYRSIGNSGGMLLGMVPDYILVKESGRKYEDIVIGICPDTLSSNGDYKGIFGLESLDGGSV